MLHSKSPAEPAQSPMESVLNRTLTQHPQVVSGPSVQETIMDGLQSPALNMHSGSLVLKQVDGWIKGASVGAGRKPTPPHCLAAEELGEAGPAQTPQHPQLAETDLFSATAQECGLRWSSRCWKEGCNQSHPPRKIPAPLTEGKEQERPLHSQIYGPQQAGKNPVNISANPASVRSYRVIGVSPCQSCSCCPS